MPDKSVTTNVIPFRERLKEKYGDYSFMLCGCQNHGGPVSGMLPVVQHDAQGAFICAVVCVDCENETAISFGRPYAG